MADATFDGDNLYIILPNIGSFNTQTNIYSAWKEWIRLSDNAKYSPAFDTTGGDDVGGGQLIAPYFFCRNDLGWRIKMPAANGEIVLSGNLFPRVPSISLFEQTTGFDAFLRLEVSTRAVVIERNTTGLTAQESSKLDEIHKIHGLDVENDLTVTKTSRSVGTLSQTINTTGTDDSAQVVISRD